MALKKITIMVLSDGAGKVRQIKVPRCFLTFLLVAALSQKIDQITLKMQDLREFDHKLRVMVNMETKGEAPQFLGMGQLRFVTSWTIVRRK